MRNLTKAFFSFSWAMTLFGLEQLRTTFSDEKSGDRSDQMAEDFDVVAEAARERLGKRNASMYESGDKLQREMVDMMFDVVRGDEVKPRSVLDRAADLVEDSADALRDLVGDSDKDKDKKKTTRKRRTGTTKKSASKPTTQSA